MLKRIAGLTALIVLCSAHVGSPDAWYEGTAGPYRVVVQVATPGVVPGVANVYARVTGAGVEQVTVQANRFDALASAPPPEVAEPVEGDAGLYSAPLWIMTGGSNSVTVNVRGTLGEGKAVIPVVVVANRRLALDPKLGALLVVVGLFLFVGLISIIGAAVREGVLTPGEQPDAHRRWKARTTMGLSAAVLALVLFGGSRWWNSEDERFNETIYKPLTSVASVERNVLNLRVTDSVWIKRADTAWLNKHRGSRWTPLIRDHGKLVHVFMVREPDLLAFAHLHPTSTDSVNFPSTLPALPAGHYRVYGDIVHESGFTQTLTTTVDLPVGVEATTKLGDPDDASYFATTQPDASNAVLEDGSTMTLDHAGKFTAGKNAELRFTVRDKSGQTLALEPYIGMAGHAVVTRDDGAVFVHLHPSGTISMASQLAFTMRTPADTVTGELGKRIQAAESAHAMPALPTPGTVTFPYAFPKPGKYHMWVQVKHAGRILTGPFAFEIAPAKG
ncbi:MAG TPA: hypothetical protein VM166_11845 [Gemmatimonadaceae bacterium]|nr:hypothetical protein [Gemmatimonadaceae bacterium]